MFRPGTVYGSYALHKLDERPALLYHEGASWQYPEEFSFEDVDSVAEIPHSELSSELGKSGKEV